MQPHNSVFHQITNHIPWSVFDRLVSKHCGDFRVRRLNSKSHLMALLVPEACVRLRRVFIVKNQDCIIWA